MEVSSSQLKRFAFVGYLALALVVQLVFPVGYVSLTANEAQAAVEIPQLLNYQARITDDSGVPVADGALSVKIAIYDSSSGGTCLWSAGDDDATSTTIDCDSNTPDAAISVTVKDGVFSVVLGDTSASQNELPDDLFSATTRYLGLTVASDSEMTPRKRITASPYAFNADLLDDLDSSNAGGTSAHIVAADSNGNVIITGDPQGTAVGQGSLYINPASASSGETLFGVADNGTGVFTIDKEGDTTATGTLTVQGASGTQNFFEVLDDGGAPSFTVSATGTTIVGVPYVWPTSQAGGSGYYLSNNGSGTLSWADSSGLGATSLQGAYENATSTPATIDLNSTRGGIRIADEFAGLGSNLLEIVNQNGTAAISEKYFTVSATSVAVLSDDPSGIFEVFQDTADTGRLAVFGPADSTFSDDVRSNYLNISNSYIGFHNNLEAGTGLYNGLAVVAENNVVTDTSGLQAFTATANSSHASGNKGLVASAFFQSTHSGTGTVSTITDVAVYPRSTASSGTVTDVNGIEISPSLLGTTTNLYRLKIEEGTSAGTITNSYGIYIDELEDNGDTLNYAIYSDTPGAPFVVRADGWVGIGDATPTSALTVTPEVATGNYFEVTEPGGKPSFTVSATGTTIVGVPYVWPTSQAGGSGYYLSNNGSGTLSWADSSALGADTLQSAYDNDVDGSGVTITTNSTDGDLRIYGDQDFVIGSGVDVAIGGDTSPDGKFEVYSSDATHTDVIIDNDGGGDPMINWKIGGFRVLTMGLDNSDGDAFHISDSDTVGSTSRFRVDASTGDITISEDLTVSSRILSAAHANNQGLLLPTNAGAPSSVAGTTEGDIVWDSTNDALYVYDGGDFAQIGGGGGVSSLQGAYEGATSTPATIDLNATRGGLRIADEFAALGANLLEITDSTYNTRYFSVSSTSTQTTSSAVLGDASNTDTVTFNSWVASNFTPSTDDTYDLGDHDRRWRDLYLGPGSLHIGTSKTDEGIITYDTSNNILNFSTDSTAAGDIAFFSENLYIDRSAARVGIGNSAPGALLDIVGTASSDGIFIDNTATTGDPIIGFQLSGTSQFTMGVDDSSTNDDFVISDGASIGSNDRLTIDGSSGDVSLGTGNLLLETSAPTIKLSSSGATLDFDDANDNTMLSIADGGSTGLVSVYGSGSSNALRIYGFTSASEQADLYVQTNGSLRIDTRGGSDTGGYVEVWPEDDEYGFRLNESDGTGGGSVYSNFYTVDAVDDYLNIRVTNPTSTTDGIFITDEDRLGINTSTPNAELVVADTAGSPTNNIFEVQNFGGSSKYLTVSSTSTIITGDLTVSGTCTGCGSTTLQGAYDNDADGSDVTITMNSTDGALILAGDQNFNITTTGDTNFDSNTLYVDSSADSVGIGTSSPDGTLQVEGSSYPVASITRTTTLTDTDLASIRATAETSNNAVDGFGSQIIFDFTDSGVSNSILGTISGIRDGSDTEGALVFKAGSSGVEEFMRIDNDGNVGIGTSSPDGILEVEGSSQPVLRATRTSSGTNNDLTTIRVTHETSANAVDGLGSLLVFDFTDTGVTHSTLGAVGAVRDGSDTEGALIFKAGTNGTEEFMRIDNDGQVGIGTNAIPHGGVGGAMLALEGTNSSISAGPHIQFTTSTDNYPLLQILPFTHDNTTLNFDSYWDGSFWRSSDAGSNFQIGKATDELTFNYDSGNAQGGTVTFVEGFALESDGDLKIDTDTIFVDASADRVGMGDTTPDAKLDVYSTASSDGIFIDNGAGTGDPILGFQLTGTSGFTLGIDDSTTNDDFVISDGSALGTNNRLSIDGSTGDITIANDLTVTDLTINGTCTGCGGGVSDLQGAYDGGQTIEVDETTAVTITQTASAVNVTNDILKLEAATTSTGTFQAGILEIAINGDTGDFTGDGIHMTVDEAAMTSGALLLFEDEDDGNDLVLIDEDGNLTIDGNLTVDGTGAGTFAGDLDINGTGNSDFAGNVVINGNTTIGSASGDSLTINAGTGSIANDLVITNGANVSLELTSTASGVNVTDDILRLHANTTSSGTFQAAILEIHIDGDASDFAGTGLLMTVDETAMTSGNLLLFENESAGTDIVSITENGNFTTVGTVTATGSGTHTFGGDLDVNGTGDTDFAGNVVINGNTTIGSASGDTLTVNAGSGSLANTLTLETPNTSAGLVLEETALGTNITGDMVYLHANTTGAGTYQADILDIHLNGDASDFAGTGLNITVDQSAATAAANAFVVETEAESALFEIDENGDITTLRGVTYSWPSSQAGGSGYYLSNNGSGTLTWEDSSGLGGSTLQQAYDAGATIELDGTGPVIITETGSGSSNDLLQLTGLPTSANSGDLLQLTMDSTVSGGFDGDGLHIIVDDSQVDGNAILVEDDGSSDYFQITSDGDTNIDANTLYVDSSADSVGIGETAPDDALEIAGALGGYGIHLDSSSGAGIQLDRGATSNAAGIHWQTAGSQNWFAGTRTDSDSDWELKSGSWDGTAVITVDGTTLDVSIGGDASPDAALDVETNGSADGIIINNTASDGDGILQFQNNGTVEWTLGWDDGDSDFFKIGTTALGTNTAMEISSTTQISFGDTITPDGQFSIRQDDAGDLFNLYDGSTNVFTVLDGGDVGIGTDSPATALDILASNADQLRLSNTTSNSTLKNAYIQGRHYTNAEEDIALLLANGNSSTNVLHIGGGSSALNTMTEIKFYTAANNTTVTGTEQMSIDSSGDVTFTGDIVGIDGVTYDWPSSQAAGSGYYLSNNGSGTLSWADPSSLGATSLQGAYENATSTPATIDLNSTRGGLRIADEFATLGANLFEITDSTYNTRYLSVSTTSTRLTDDHALVFGASADAELFYNTDQTADTLFLGVGADSNALVIGENADSGFDFSHAAQSSPTLFIHSADQNTTDWVSLTHDGSQGELQTGAGGFVFDTAGNTVRFPNNENFVFGSNVSDFRLIYSTTQTPDTAVMGLGDDGNSLVVVQSNPGLTGSFDFAHPLQSNPTIFVHSANNSTDEWISISHDQTDGGIDVGTGGLNLLGGSGSTGCTIDSSGNLTCSGTVSSSGQGSGLQGAYESSTSTPATIDLNSTRGGVRIADEFASLGANLFEITDSIYNTAYFSVSSTSTQSTVQFQGDNGSASAPTYSFSGGTGLGIFRSGNTLGVSGNGTVSIFPATAAKVDFSSTDLSPRTNDDVALGTTSEAWSDLYLATGGVLDFGSSDVTLTHSTDQLALSGALTVADVAGSPAGNILEVWNNGGSEKYFTVSSTSTSIASGSLSSTLVVDAGSTDARIDLDNAGTNRWRLFNDATSGSDNHVFKVKSASSSDNSLVIMPTGEVAIGGVDSPEIALVVSDDEGSPTNNIFEVWNDGGGEKYFTVSSTGTLITDGNSPGAVDALLHVNGSGSIFTKIQGTNDVGLYLDNGGTVRWSLRNDSSGAGESHAFILAGGLATPVVLSAMPSGLVGINTNAPDAALTVADTTTTSNIFEVTDDSGTGTYTTRYFTVSSTSTIIAGDLTVSGTCTGCGGGASSLQGAYDGGQTIELDGSNSVVITETGVGSATDYMQITAAHSGTAQTGDLLQLTMDHATSNSFDGHGLHIIADLSQVDGDLINIEDDAGNEFFVVDQNGDTYIDEGTLFVDAGTNEVYIGNELDTSPDDILEVSTNSGNGGITINNTSGSDHDATLQFQIGNSDTWIMGADDSDSDHFKIAKNGTLGLSNAFEIDASTRNVEINNDLSVTGGDLTFGQSTNTITSTSSNPIFRFEDSSDNPLFIVDDNGTSGEYSFYGSNSLGITLYGLDEAAEEVEFIVGSAGQLVIDWEDGSDTGGYMEIRTEDDNYGLRLIESDGTATGVYANFYVVDDTEDYLNITVEAAGSVAGLVVDDDEQVGIGNLAPDVILDIVSATSGADGITIDNTATTGDPILNFQLSGTDQFTLGVDDSTTNDDFVISSGSTLGTNNRITIDGSTGDVAVDTDTIFVDVSESVIGVGTSSPNAGVKLDLTHSGAISSGISAGLRITDSTTGSHAATKGGLVVSTSGDWTGAASYGAQISNNITNSSADSLDKVALDIDSFGTYTGGGGGATQNWGIYVGTVTGADENYAAYFNGSVGIGSDDTPDAELENTGSTILGDASNTDTVTLNAWVGSNITPETDDTYDLGDHDRRWQDLYLGPGSLHIGTSQTDEGIISYDTTNNILNFSTDATGAGDIAFFSETLYLDKSTGTVGIGTSAGASTTAFKVESSQTTTGTGIDFECDNLTGGICQEISSSSAILAGDLLQLYHNGTYTAASPTLSGKAFDVRREPTYNNGAGTLTITGPVARFYSDVTLTSGSLSDSSNVVEIEQDETNNTGSALNVTTAGSGFALRANDDGTLTDSTPFVVDDAGKVGIGTTDVPYGTDGGGMLQILGTASSALNGPHIQMSIDTSGPTMQLMNWSHDNIAINFDAYYDNASSRWESSDSGSNFNIYKMGDDLDFNYESGVSAGGQVTWSAGLTMQADGEIQICNGTCSGISISDGAGDLFVEDELDVQGNVRIDAGTLTILKSTGTATFGICTQFNGGVVDVVRDCSSSPSDLAEWYPVTTSATSSDILVASGTMFEYDEDLIEPWEGQETGETATYEVPVLDRSSTPYDSRIVGVFSTSPWQTFGEAIKDSATTTAPLALTGHVPVRVVTENGSIAVGDPITTSSTAGAGMKATKPGTIVGFALDSWSGPGEGEIQVRLEPGYHSGSAIGTDGTLALFLDDFTYDAKDTATASVTSYDSNAQSFRTSVWDSASSTAVTRDISISNSGTDKDTYELLFKNNDQEEIAKIGNEGDLYIAGKLFPSDEGTLQTDKYIFYDGGGDYMRTNAAGWATGSYDFAEMFPSKMEDQLEAGEIVIADSNSKEGIVRSGSAYQNTILGIISTRPGFLAGEDKENDKPVALIGRVPTKVNLENGIINIGDPITSSSVAGEGMKATEAGRVVGIALEKYDGNNVDENGQPTNKIIVYVNPSWYNGPQAAEEETTGGTLTIEANSILDFQASTLTNVEGIIGSSGMWSIGVDGHFVARRVDADYVKAKKYEINVKDEPMRTAGVGEIKAGYNAQLVQHPSIQPNSLIVLTFEGNPGSAWWISEKNAGSFMVSLAAHAPGDVKFTWWVIGVDGDLAPQEEEGEEETESASGTEETAPPEEEPPAEDPPVEEPPAEEPPAEEPPAEEPPPEEPPAPEPPPEEPPTESGTSTSQT